MKTNCNCGATGYIAVHQPNCAALILASRYAFELVFEPGTLNVKIGGDNDGRGLFVFSEDVLDYVSSGDAYREVPIEKSELTELRDFLVARFPLMPGQPGQPAQSYPVAARFTRDLALEEAAQVIEAGSLGAPHLARRIRELMQAKACGTCQGYGRDARDEGGRCQDCGGNGLAPGEPAGMHPRAELLRQQTLNTMELRRQRFGDHPPGCDGMRSGVCTCPPGHA